MTTEATIESARAKLADIYENGKYVPGICPSGIPKDPPSWYDPIAFRRAQKLYKTYGMLIALTHFYGLILELCQFDALGPLLTTGQSQTISKLYVRYLSTGRHVRNWFRKDAFDRNSKSYQSLKLVRGMHLQVFNKLNKAAKLEANGTDVLWFNQCAMCKVQFAFFGLMALFPKELGYHKFKARDFEAMFHFWRVIGFCLGIDDKYNLCNGTFEQVLAICRLIFDGEFKQNMSEFKEMPGLEMGKGLSIAFSRINPLMDYSVMFRYFAPCLQMNRKQFPLVGFVQHAKYCILKLTIQHLCKLSKFQNRIYTLYIDYYMNRAVRKCTQNENYLQQKYKDVEYNTDNQCPFQIEIHYRPQFRD